MELWEIVTDLTGLALVGGLLYRLGLIHGDMLNLKDRVGAIEDWRNAFTVIPKL